MSREDDWEGDWGSCIEGASHLEGIDGLVLLLVEPADGAPGVGVGLALVYRVSVVDEGVVGLGRQFPVAAAEEVVRPPVVRLHRPGLVQVVLRVPEATVPVFRGLGRVAVRDPAYLFSIQFPLFNPTELSIQGSQQLDLIR